MPYIEQSKRKKLDPVLRELDVVLEQLGDVDGDYNYVISCLLWRMLKRTRRYTTMNKIKGVLASVRDEFNRRFVDPYEDLVARPKNGDIDPYWWQDDGENEKLMEGLAKSLPFDQGLNE